MPTGGAKPVQRKCLIQQEMLVARRFGEQPELSLRIRRVKKNAQRISRILIREVLCTTRIGAFQTFHRVQDPLKTIGEFHV
jgi:hypothetical protein